ncbi:MAG: DUF935 family protein [bacterium]
MKPENLTLIFQEAVGYIENFDEALLDLCDAIGKGLAMSEIMYDYSEGQVWIKELKSIEQRRFTFADSENMGMVLDYPRLLTENDPFRGDEAGQI